MPPAFGSLQSIFIHRMEEGRQRRRAAVAPARILARPVGQVPVPFDGRKYSGDEGRAQRGRGGKAPFLPCNVLKTDPPKMKNRGAQGGGEGTAVDQRWPREEERAAYGVQVSGGSREEESSRRSWHHRSGRRRERRMGWGRTFGTTPGRGPEMPGRRRGISGIQRMLREEERASVSGRQCPAGAGRRRAPAGPDITGQGGGEAGELVKLALRI